MCAFKTVVIESSLNVGSTGRWEWTGDACCLKGQGLASAWGARAGESQEEGALFPYLSRPCWALARKERKS